MYLMGDIYMCWLYTLKIKYETFFFFFFFCKLEFSLRQQLKKTSLFIYIFLPSNYSLLEFG